MGQRVIKQGDVWLLEQPGEKARPCLVLTRDDALPLLTAITIAPLTSTIRDIPSEVRLGPDDGVRIESVASFDNVRSVSKGRLTRQLGRLAPGRWHEVCFAVRAAIAC